MHTGSSGFLHPLDILKARWQDISMDIVVDLPDMNGYNALLVVVDRLTKRLHLLETKNTATAEDTARLYFE